VKGKKAGREGTKGERGGEEGRRGPPVEISGYATDLVNVNLGNQKSTISGKHSAQKINHLHVNGAEVTDVSDIGNTLCETFSDNSSSDHCSTSFKSYKQNTEKYSISFMSNNTETYNNPFSMDELTNAISKSHDTAVGPNSSHYRMLKNLLLGALNYIWTTGNFLPEWHLATVIPIAKPGKDATDPTSYRPIALNWLLVQGDKHQAHLVLGKAQTDHTSPKWL